MTDQKDMLRPEFLFMHELCRPYPDPQILSILRANSWDVNMSVNIALQRIAAKLNYFEVMADQAMFHVGMDAMTPCFFDFTVYLLPHKELPIGISLEVTLNSYANEDDEARSPACHDDRGVICIRHVLPKSLALIAGIKPFDRILRLNGELVSLANSSMQIDDLYDQISIIRAANEVVALSCRRVLLPLRYCTLPLASQQYYLVPSLPVPDMTLMVGQKPKNRENNMDSDSFGSFIHPSVHFLVQQRLLTDRRRAVLLHRVTIGIKEACMKAFERVYFDALEVLLADTVARRRKASSALKDAAGALSYLSVGDSRAEEPVVCCLSRPTASHPNKLRKFSSQLKDKRKSIKSINKHIDNREICSLTTANNEIVTILSSYLRSALTVRINRTEKFIPAGASPIASLSDVNYIISVYDVTTASAWTVKRSYEQFYSWRQALLLVREPQLSALPFPIKRVFKVMEHMVMSKRQMMLDGFLRDVVRIATTMNPRYLSSIKLRILIDRFLDVNIQYEDLNQYFTDSLLAKYDDSEYLIVADPFAGAGSGSTARVSAAHSAALGAGSLEEGAAGPTSTAESGSAGGAAPAVTSRAAALTEPVRFCSSQLQFLIETSLSVFIQHVLCQEEYQSLVLTYVSTWWELPEEVLAALDGKAVVLGHGHLPQAPELVAQQAACDACMERQLLSLRTFMDNMQCLTYNSLVEDCFDIITSYGAYHSSRVTSTDTASGGSCGRSVTEGAAEVEYSAVWEPRTPATGISRPRSTSNSPSRLTEGGGAATLNTLVQNMVCDRYYCSSVTFNPLLAQYRHKMALQLPVLVPDESPSSEGSCSGSDGANANDDKPEAACAEVEYLVLDMYVQNAIRRQLEMELCAPHIYKHIRKYFTRQFAAKEEQFNEKVGRLKDKPQSYFGIPPELVSPSDWYDVKKSFRMIRKGLLPQELIAGFLDAIKMITIVCHLEHAASAQSKDGAADKPAGASEHSKPSGEHRTKTTIIGADDLLPIMVYILVNAKCVNILALNEEFKQLCPCYLKLTETGYYLTTLDAALEHIMESGDDCYGGFSMGRGRATSTAYDVEGVPGMPSKPGVPRELKAALAMKISDTGMDAIASSSSSSGGETATTGEAAAAETETVDGCCGGHPEIAAASTSDAVAEGVTATLELTEGIEKAPESAPEAESRSEDFPDIISTDVAPPEA